MTDNKPKRTAQIDLNMKKSISSSNSQKEQQEKKEQNNVNNSMDTTKQSNFAKESNKEQPQQSSGNVKVVCRVRPLNKKELGMSENLCVGFLDQQTIQVKTSSYTGEVGPGTHKFAFDRVFDINAQQRQVYEFAAKPVVESVLEGFNGTVFAYGQTGSGKTFTMQGPNIEDDDLQGIIPRMVNTVFDYITNAPDHIEFTVKCSMCEIYMEKIRDLFSPEKTNLKVREDKSKGIYIEDATECYVSEENDVFELMKLGNSHRAISATNMNEGSSRSHMLFMMSIHQNNLHEMSAKTGKLYLVDLAGSEKVGKTGASGSLLEEAKMINKSLSALGNVINALTDAKGQQHIPYRDSKLTRVLQESLGGNARTTLIITCSPSPFNDAETLSTLRFGYRAKSIKNKPKINREFTVAELQMLLERAEKTIEEKEKRIKQLEALLEEHDIDIPKDIEEKIEQIKKDVKKEKSAVKEEDGEEESDEDDEQRQVADLKVLSLIKDNNNEDLARIKLLESELDSERKNVKTQTEKVNILRKEFNFINAKLLTAEKENEALIHKLATFHLKQQEAEDKYSDVDSKIEELISARESLLTENEELKRSKDHLLRQVKELQQQSEKVVKKRTSNSPNKKPSSSAMMFGQKLQSMMDFDADEVTHDITKELSSKFGINDTKGLSSLIFGHLKKAGGSTQNNTQNSEQSPRPSTNNNRLETTQDLPDATYLQDELEKQKQLNQDLQSNSKKIQDKYEQLLQSKGVDVEKLKQEAANDVLNSEKNKYDKEKHLLIQDLQSKDDRVSKLEKELELEKGKLKNFEKNVQDGEKLYRSRIDALEGNVESLNALCHKLRSQESRHKVEGQIIENKLQRKTERIMGLEKQLHDTKQLVEAYKSKIESLKSLILVSSSQNIPANQIFSEGDNDDGSLLSNPEALNLSKKASSTNAKIVKHIRGGQIRKSGAGNAKVFAQALKQHNNNLAFSRQLLSTSNTNNSNNNNNNSNNSDN